MNQHLSCAYHDMPSTITTTTAATTTTTTITTTTTTNHHTHEGATKRMAPHLDVVLEEDGIVVGGGRVERLRHGGDEATPLDAVVDLLFPEWPVHALTRKTKKS